MMSTYVAGGVIGSVSGGSNTFSLYTPSNNQWTGTGTYDAYVMLYNGSSYKFYKKTGVSITNTNTSLSAGDFSLTTLP
jgi:hypothetical protein